MRSDPPSTLLDTSAGPHAPPWLRLAGAASLLLLLAACGGGGGDTVTVTGGSSASGGDAATPLPTPTSMATTISGVAAVGAPLVGAEVRAQCLGGERAALSPTDTRGAYTIELQGAAPPCLLQVRNGTVGGGSPHTGVLHGLALSTGLAQLNPFTELALARAFGQAPATVYAAFRGSASIPGASTLAGSTSWLSGQLVTLGLTAPQGDVFAGSFAIGDTNDQILDALGARLAAATATMADLRTAAATSSAFDATLTTMRQAADLRTAQEAAARAAAEEARARAAAAESAAQAAANAAAQAAARAAAEAAARAAAEAAARAAAEAAAREAALAAERAAAEAARKAAADAAIRAAAEAAAREAALAVERAAAEAAAKAAADAAIRAAAEAAAREATLAAERAAAEAARKAAADAAARAAAEAAAREAALAAERAAAEAAAKAAAEAAVRAAAEAAAREAALAAERAAAEAAAKAAADAAARAAAEAAAREAALAAERAAAQAAAHAAAEAAERAAAEAAAKAAADAAARAAAEAAAREAAQAAERAAAEAARQAAADAAARAAAEAAARAAAEAEARAAAEAAAVAADTVSGIATTGEPVIDATVDVRCVSGSPQTTARTDGLGHFSLRLYGAAGPCLLQVRGGAQGGQPSTHVLHAWATHGGTVVQATPLVELLLGYAWADRPANRFAHYGAADALAADTVAAARASVLSQLATLGLPVGSVDGLAGSVSAGDATSLLLQALAQKLYDLGSNQGVVAATAAARGNIAATVTADRNVAVQFAAVAGETPAQCGTTTPGLGRDGLAARLLDFRFYISEAELLRADGSAVRVRLGTGSGWQYTGPNGDGVTLIDLEDGSAECATEGTQGMNAQLWGTVPAGRYTGMRLTLGVPQSLNHTDTSAVPAPLDSLAMGWGWTAGRKFAKIEVADPVPGTWRLPLFYVHVGSTNCSGNAGQGTVQCATPNRAALVFDSFDTQTQKVAVDLRALLAGTDITTNQGGALGCMSAGTDRDCEKVFAALGIHWLSTGKGTGQVLDGGRAQTVFKAVAK